MTMVVGMFTNLMTRYGNFIHIYLIQSCKMLLQLHIISINYFLGCLRKKMIRYGTMWYQKDGYAKQYMCSIAYYLIYFLSKSHQIVLDRAVDTPGHGKDVVDGFNDVQKQYLANCLRMSIMPEVDNIESKRMRVYAMTKNVEVRFSK